MTPFVLGLGLWAAFNPAWPSSDPGTPPEALEDPALQPDDPGYAPWTRGGPCDGQLSFYGFTPPCIAGRTEGGVGAGVDRAWLRTLGRPTITIAIIGEGVDLTDPDLAPQVRLNPGELPRLGEEPLDRNADGVVSVLDFMSATATEALTLDRVVDPRLVQRPDRGDVNGNGRLDPIDLVRIFSDGADNDENGLTDDIAGWDFLGRDAEALPQPLDRTGTASARTAAARANDGFGVAGACPRCTLLPVRVGARGLASGVSVALGLLYAADRGSRVAAVRVAVPGASPLLFEAMDRAGERGLAVIAAAGVGAYPSLVEDLPVPSNPRVLLVSAVGFEQAPSSASSGVGALPCAHGALDLDAVISGARCPQATPAGLAAGIVALMYDVALTTPRAPSGPTDLLALLVGTARPFAGVPWSPRRGWGRLDARAAVDAVRDGRPPLAFRFLEPPTGTVIDPTFGAFPVRAELSGPVPPSGITWRLALGRGVAPATFEQVAEGVLEAGDRPIIEASVDLSGWLEDPARTPTALDPFALALRLSVEARVKAEALDREDARVVFVGADLDLLPGFPVALGAGAFGGPRIADLDGNGQPDIWVALLDGALVAIDRTGQIMRRILGRPIVGPQRLIERAGLRSSPAVPRLAAPTFRSGPQGAVLGSVDADDVLTLVDASGIRALGAAVELDDTHPAGWVSPAMAFGFGSEGDRFTWPGPEGIRRESGDEASIWRALDAPAGPLALERVDAQARVWTRSGPALVSSDGDRFDLPSAALAFRGLRTLRAEAPVVADVVGFGRSVALIGSEGVGLRTEGEDFRILEVERGTIFAPTLSAGRGRIILWLKPLDEGAPPQPRAIPRPSSANLTRADLDPSLAEVVVTDVDGGEEEHVFGGDLARLFAVSENGLQASGWPKLTGRPVLSAPALGDLDGDGTVEVAAVTRDGALFVWRTRGQTNRVDWAGERHDLAGTARSGTPFSAALPGTEGDGCTCASAGPTSSERAGACSLALIAVIALRLGRRTRPRSGSPRP